VLQPGLGHVSPSGIGFDIVSEFVFPILATLGACALVALYLRALSASNRFDLPNQRSMHTAAIPSGAGVAVVATVVVFWLASQNFAPGRIHVLLMTAFALLAALSWVDDHRRLTPGVRLAGHALAVAVLLGALAPDQRVVPALPLLAERFALGIAWLWFINLFNFMDGIDGLAGGEAIAIAVGYYLVAAAAGPDTPLAQLALIAAGACAGYLVWNWHPAKVFMGDAGSIPLGFLLGWLMIDLAFGGHWAAALILPLYFGADATLTLCKRLRRGEKPWQPHREHVYQRAVLGGATPPAVVWRVNAVNALLIVLAVLSTRFPVLSLVAAVAAVAGLLMHLERLARG
jgi:UDP-N-acetylmuramyl pentapeptide phosphotransferase/UDP-N-acetylglucosamine-1-phosphate transferase